MLEYCPAGRLWDVVKPLGELYCKFNLHCDPSALLTNQYRLGKGYGEREMREREGKRER